MASDSASAQHLEQANSQRQKAQWGSTDWGNRQLLLNGCRVSVGGDEQAVEVMMLLECTLKNG